MALLAVGCATDRIDIEAEDRARLMPGAKASVQIFPRQERERGGLLGVGGLDAIGPRKTTSAVPMRSGVEEGGASGIESSPATPAASHKSPASEGTDPTESAHETAIPEPRKRIVFQPLLAIDMDYRAGIGGKDERRYSAPQFVEYDGTIFPGPQQIQYDFEYHLAAGGVRGGFRLFEALDLELVGGLSVSALHLVARAPDLRAGDTSIGLGSNIGARGTISPHPVFDLYGEWRFHLLRGQQKDHEEIIMTTADVGANLHLTRNASVFGGWRWWAYDEEVTGESDVHSRMTGPTLGLLLRF